MLFIFQKFTSQNKKGNFDIGTLIKSTRDGSITFGENRCEKEQEEEKQKEEEERQRQRRICLFHDLAGLFPVTSTRTYE